jgi:hypothetical protein
VREDDLFGLDATEDLFSSGIQSGEELLEDFTGSGTSSSGSAFGSSGGDLFDEGDGWGF